MKKRLFAAVLCLILTVCLLPGSALAADIICGVGPDANGRYKTGDVYVLANTQVHLVADIYDAVPGASVYWWWYRHLPNSEIKEGAGRIWGLSKDLGTYEYFCTVDGTGSSNALTLTFRASGITDGCTNFVQIPQNQTVALGETATFTAKVTYVASVGQVVYQWYQADDVRAPWVAINGATGPSCTPPVLTAANADTLYCVRAVAHNNATGSETTLFESDSVRLVPAAPAASVPKTGDDTPLILLCGLALFSAAGLAASAVRRRRGTTR